MIITIRENSPFWHIKQYQIIVHKRLVSIFFSFQWYFDILKMSFHYISLFLFCFVLFCPFISLKTQFLMHLHKSFNITVNREKSKDINQSKHKISSASGIIWTSRCNNKRNSKHSIDDDTKEWNTEWFTGKSQLFRKWGIFLANNHKNTVKKKKNTNPLKLTFFILFL